MQPVGAHYPRRAVEGSGVAAYHGDIYRERCQESKKGSGDPAAAHDGDPPAHQAVSRRRAPFPCLRPGGQLAQAREPQRQGVLGDGCGVCPLRAGPDPLMVDDREEAIDTGRRQLNTSDAGRHHHQFAESGCIEGIGPHQCFCLGDVHDHAAPRANGVGNDRCGRPWRHGTTNGHTAQR